MAEATLLKQQKKFSRLLALFVTQIYAQGYTVSFGEVWRSPEEAAIQAAKGAGIVRSLHTMRLAADLNVFDAQGTWLQTVEDLRPVSEAWKALDPDCCWGGDFITRPDADHYSLTWQGIK